MKTMLVELKSRGEREFSLSDIFSRRKWWPVYVKGHRDPDLGKFGQQPHYHIALNRLTNKFLMRNRRLLSIAIIPTVDIVGYHAVDSPIKSHGWVPHPGKDLRKLMIANWKKRRRTASSPARDVT